MKLKCFNCGEEYDGPELEYCCNGSDCGCNGLPIDPILCEPCEHIYFNGGNYE
jgi:hypothetical protein